MGYGDVAMARRPRIAQRVDPVVDCMLIKHRLQFFEFLWVSLCEIDGLRKVFFDVVQLPNFLWAVKFKTLQADPWKPTMETRGDPAVFIDGSVAQDLEILRGVSAWCAGAVKRISHRCAMNWRLLDAVDKIWWSDARDFVNCWRDVDDMMKLRAQSFGQLDFFRPRNRKCIAGAAEV